jgi:ubiquinone/menaquinone biosynthesis C-methylase UbiE
MPTPPKPGPTPERISQFAWGYTVPLILEAAVRNGVFDTLDSGPKAVEEVSRLTGASVRGLRAIMNALVGLDLLAKDGADLYTLTPESAAFLVSTKPGYAGGILRHTSQQLIPNWLHLSEVVRTGKPASSVNQQSQGAEFFHDFVEDIFPMSYPAAKALANHLNAEQLPEPTSVLDIAAGSGVWGIALAQSSQHIFVTAVDWEHVLDVTRRVSARFGLTDRFTYVGGDLLTANFGAGHRIATLGHILHSEGEGRSKKLLTRVFDALMPGGVIVIAEMITNTDRTGPSFPLLFAVNMLVNSDEGDTYSFDEMKAWLVEAGFVDVRTFDSPGPSPLLLATKPA